MSEKKLRRILTSAAVATSLFLTAAAGASAAEPQGRRSQQIRGGEQFHIIPGDSRPFSLWKFLVSVWEKRGVGMDPDGLALRSYADSEAPTSSRSDVDQGGR